MNIAVEIYLGPRWLAGLTSVLCIGAGLKQRNDPGVALTLVVGPDAAPDMLAQAQPYAAKVIAAPTLAQTVEVGRPRRLSVQWLRQQLTGRRAPVSRIATVYRQQGVDCLFSSPLDRHFEAGVPRVVWLPDFQHRHLPAMFSAQECQQRDRLYRREIEAATLVAVKAESVRHDLLQFAPEHGHKVRVLPFVVPVPASVYERDPAEVAARYHLPPRYLFMPNHFWQHKNHGLVLEALKRLKDRGQEVNVVCTGHLDDARHPAYVPDLFRRVSLYGLRAQFIALGAVPSADVLGLMRQSVAVVNPSLFEGFGFSVAEAISLGKRVLLSDLPPHREQDPPGAVYFDPRDATDLASKLAEVWAATPPGPDAALEAHARQALPARQRRFAEQFVGLAKEAARLYQARAGS